MFWLLWFPFWSVSPGLWCCSFCSFSMALCCYWSSRKDRFHRLRFRYWPGRRFSVPGIDAHRISTCCSSYCDCRPFGIFPERSVYYCPSSLGGRWRWFFRNCTTASPCTTPCKLARHWTRFPASRTMTADAFAGTVATATVVAVADRNGPVGRLDINRNRFLRWARLPSP